MSPSGPAAVLCRRALASLALPALSLVLLAGLLPGPAAHARTARTAPTPLRSGEIVLALRTPHAAALDRFVSGLYRPGSASFHRFLTPRRFAIRFGAPPRELATVLARLRTLGIGDARVAPDRLYVTVPLGARVARRAAALRRGDALRRGLGGLVSAVIEPGQQPTPRPLLTGATPARAAGSARAAVPTGVAGGATPCRSAVAAGGLTAPQLAGAYDFNGLYASGLHGEGMTAAVLEYGDYHRANVTAFERCYGLQVPVTRTSLDGGPGSVAGSSETEVTLDIDVIAEMAPRLARLDVIEAPNTGTGELAAYAGFVDQDRDPVLSVSWGECEEGASQSYQRLLGAITEQAAAQGQQIFVASGDVGSRGCAAAPLPTGASVSADTEAALPWVTGVGGTDLSQASSRPTPTVHREAVWNDGLGAGGGGQSGSFVMPSWQAAYLAAAGVHPSGAADICGAPRGGLCRMVPDIALNADAEEGGADPAEWNVPDGPAPVQFAGTGDRGSAGYTVFCATANCQLSHSGFGRVGGTSAATPLAAAAAVLADEAAARSGVRLGFLDPALYAIASDRTAYLRDFHDVTTGSDDARFTNGACLAACTREYAAGRGYDMATGLGSFDAARLGADLLTQAGAITLTPASETMYGDTGGGPVTTAPVSVTGPLRAGTAGFRARSDAAWLSVAPTGTAPGELRWHVDPAGLAPGTYRGTITVTAVDGSIATLSVRYEASPPARIGLLTRSLHFAERRVKALGALPTRTCRPLWGDELESHGQLPGLAGLAVPGDEVGTARRLLRFANVGAPGSQLHWALDQTRVAWISNDLDPHGHPRAVRVRPGAPLVPSVGRLDRGAREAVHLASIANANTIGGYPTLAPGTYHAALILRDLADPADTRRIPVTLTLGDGRDTPTIAGAPRALRVTLSPGAQRRLRLRLSDPGGRCGYGYSLGSDSGWVRPLEASRVGSVAAHGGRTVLVLVRVPAGTAPGTYRLALTVASLNAAVAERRIPITVQVP